MSESGPIEMALDDPEGNDEGDGESGDYDGIEAGRPTAENVLFVLLGALATLSALARVAGLV